MKRICCCFLVLIFSATLTSAQSIDTLSPGQYFDFWIGKWDLTYQQKDGTIAKAQNNIYRILSGTTIQENFKVIAGANKGYTGKSWSVYNPRSKEWKQTWVDSEGAYLTFDGKIDGNKRIFFRTATNPEGKTIYQRMVFYEITENSFTWDWEQSNDAGKNWTLLWRINYKRKSE